MQARPDRQLQRLLWISAALRLLLLGWGEVQDRLLAVKYTDIDYVVFTDAARFVAQGGSPFDRSTYRYSPLLAYLLLPNIWLHGAWGKLLFCAGDILAAVLIVRLLRRLRTPTTAITLAITVWLYNPYTMTISTRGSCDVLAVLLLLAMLQLLLDGRVLLAAVAYGLVVHLRIYPIIFAPTLVLFLAKQHVVLQKRRRCTGVKLAPPQQLQQQQQQQQERQQQQQQQGNGDPLTPSHRTDMVSVQGSLWVHSPAAWSWPLLQQGMTFGLASGGVFLLLSAAFYGLYGQQFVQEAYLHHLTRKDPRHNFSPHFYPTYLTFFSQNAWQPPSSQASGTGAALAQALQWAASTAAASTALDQAACNSSDLSNCTAADMSYFSSATPSATVPMTSSPWVPNVPAWSSLCQYGLQLVLAMAMHWDLPGCLLLQTMAFVALNKVCTAQYFVWYFSLLPLILPRIAWPPPRSLLVALGAWIALQLHWLMWGYLLEFQGQPVHLALWGASILFLGANVNLMVQLIKSLYATGHRAIGISFQEACLQTATY